MNEAIEHSFDHVPQQMKATGERFTVLKGSIKTGDPVKFEAFDDVAGDKKEYSVSRVLLNRGFLTRVMSVATVEEFCNNQMLEGNYEKEGKV